MKLVFHAFFVLRNIPFYGIYKLRIEPLARYILKAKNYFKFLFDVVEKVLSNIYIKHLTTIDLRPYLQC
jgi:hypothetical protein